MNKTDLENNLDRVHEWIKSADQKISIWLAFQGIFLTIVAQPIVNILKSIKHIDLRTVIFLISLILISYSLYKTISAMSPRIKSNKHRSLLYFGDIGSISIKKYKSKLKNYSDDDLINDLILQIHISSKIAIKKHKKFNTSLILFITGAVVLFFVKFFIN